MLKKPLQYRLNRLILKIKPLLFELGFIGSPVIPLKGVKKKKLLTRCYLVLAGNNTITVWARTSSSARRKVKVASKRVVIRKNKYVISK